MNKFYLINLDTAGRWGIAVNQGTPDKPLLKLLCTATEPYARLLAEKFNIHWFDIEPQTPTPPHDLHSL